MGSEKRTYEIRQRQKRYYQEHKEEIVARHREYRSTYDDAKQSRLFRARQLAENREERLKMEYAKTKVRRAKLAGLIKQGPCAICGCGSSVAHHHNYDMPLSIVWLCVQHHVQIHQCLRVWTGGGP